MAGNPRVFISYRWDDDQSGVRRIADRLIQAFGEQNVFIDVEKIRTGDDFDERLREEVAKADVVLAMIGPRWLEEIQARAHDPYDMVRVELEFARQQGKPIVPVLMGVETSMPNRSELPESIAEITQINAASIDMGPRFNEDVGNLAQDLRKYGKSSKGTGVAAALLGGLAVVAGTAVAIVALKKDSDQGEPPIPVPLEEQTGVPETGEDFSSATGLELVWCERGTYTMGSPPEEEGRYENEVQHVVSFSTGFWIGRYEVTQEQWTRVMGHNPSILVKSGLQAPVENVSWGDAKDFCKKLNKMEGEKGRLPEGWQYDLPTEAQWEYACRAGTRTPFSFGETLNGDQANCNGRQPYGEGVLPGKYLGRTAPVGSYDPNPWGIHDMHGNVSEWCQDWYGEYPKGPVTDPIQSERDRMQVIRGGNWDYQANHCRSACRKRFFPKDQVNLLGFRVVLAPARKDGEN